VTVTTAGAQLVEATTLRFFLGRALATRLRGAAFALLFDAFTTDGRGFSA
jgi:hypothetical protein